MRPVRALFIQAVAATFVACSTSNTYVTISDRADAGAAGDAGISETGDSGPGGDGTFPGADGAPVSADSGAVLARASVDAVLAKRARQGEGLRLGSLPSAAAAASSVENGAALEAGTAVVTCRVRGGGGAYEVEATLSDGVASLFVRAELDATGAAVNAHVQLSPDGIQGWVGDDCTLQNPHPELGLAAGRYWAKLACGKRAERDGSGGDGISV